MFDSFLWNKPFHLLVKMATEIPAFSVSVCLLDLYSSVFQGVSITRISKNLSLVTQEYMFSTANESSHIFLRHITFSEFIHDFPASLRCVENTTCNRDTIEQNEVLSALFLLEISAQHIILPVILKDNRDNGSIVIFFSQNGRIHFLKKVCKHIYKSVKAINAGFYVCTELPKTAW